MEAQLSNTSSSNPLWLQKINFDVIFAIVSWLDPLSVLHLSCTSKAFRDTIGDDALVWHHALRGVINEHNLAPHSFPDPSIKNLKRLSTRPARLLESFKNPERPLHVTIEKYILDYEQFLPEIPLGATSAFQDVQYLDPYLLPGGRWILSGAINREASSTLLFCWDCTKSHVDGGTLEPVAVFTWEGWRPRVDRDWLRTQLYGENTVSLVCSLWGWVE
ncbi:hypothetical protein DL93DRAFT_542686 [Clavulina sp. PMI_390]|nr:hypothetical protein DL93DRAFT_542686 [Clavulina sp. PMI_390]